MTTGIRIPSLETKLSGANDFPTWRQHMQDMLIINDLMEIVDGTNPKPSTLVTEIKTEVPATESSGDAEQRVQKDTDDTKLKQDAANKAAKEWTKKDTIAKVYIHQNVKTELAREIPICHTSKEIWEHIVTRFDRKSPSSLHKMHRKLLSLQCTTANGLTAHLAEFTKLWSAMLEKTQSFAKQGLTVDPSFGSVIYITCISEETKAAYLLHSLQHPSFSNIVEVLEAKDHISFAEVYEKLANIGDTRQTNNPPTAFAANARRPCGYCAARSKPATHDFSVCRRYKRDQERKKGEQATSAKAQIATEVNLGAWIAQGPTYPTTQQDIEFEESTWIEDLKYFRDLEAFSQMEEREAAEALTMIKASEETAMILLSLKESAYPMIETDGWLFDTGATSHMTGEINLPNTAPHSGTVSVAGGRILQITGTLTLPVPSCNNGNKELVLKNVYVVPELGKMKLLSWKSLAEEGYSALMKGKKAVLYDREDKIVGNCQLNESGGFILKQPTNEFAYLALSGTSLDWHKRLGHPSAKTYDAIRKQFPKLPPHLEDPCDACLLGKATRQPRPRTEIKSTKPLQLVHTDLSGRFTVRPVLRTTTEF